MASSVFACTACSGGRQRPEPPPAPPPAVLDASYDWHVLVRMPFGTLLKQSPIPLHEVLLFHEGPPAESENKDCFATDDAPPRLVGRPSDTYTLCFDHDRLNRVEAGVRLSAGEASDVFAKACALWLKNTVTGSGTPPPATPAGIVCEGREGDTAFSAKLLLVPGDATATLTITLIDAAPRT
jgi:hypothetical protein